MNGYLLAAFSVVWILFMVYAWSLARRQARLKKDVDDLKARSRTLHQP